MSRYVIVGGGPTGVYAAMSIRAKDPEGSILLVDRETDIPYYRTELDTYIAGTTPDSDLPLYPADWYQEQRIELRLGTEVTGVRVTEKAVELQGGERIPYDVLLIGSGAAPVQGSWVGSQLEGVETLRSWGDARHLLQKIDTTDKPVVVVGGGVLGLILGQAIRTRGKAVVLIEKASQLWAPLLDAEASGLVRQGAERAGVEILLREEVKEAFGEKRAVEGIRTSTGKTLDTQLVVVTIGVRPDRTFLADSGVLMDQGILIDHEFKTNIPGIFAAGDVAQAYEPLTGRYRVVTNWKNAVEQGKWAGASMAGAPIAYPGVMTSNSEELFGIRVTVLGDPVAKKKGVMILMGRDAVKGLYRRLVLHKDKLIGAILVGNVSGEGMMRKAILSGTTLTTTDAKSRFLTGMVIEEQLIL